jgi:hypothetical protein
VIYSIATLAATRSWESKSIKQGSVKASFDAASVVRRGYKDGGHKIQNSFPYLAAGE